MKRITIFIILFVFLLSNKITYTINDNVYSIILAAKSGNSRLKSDLLKKHSKSYKLDTEFMARLGFVESTWDEDAISSIGCRGIYQINPVLWEHALYKIDNGRLGNKILNNNLDTKELYHDISYGIELGCFVFAWFLKKENGCYIKAAESFSGFKNKKNNKYKKYIFYLTNDCG